MVEIQLSCSFSEHESGWRYHVMWARVRVRKETHACGLDMPLSGSFVERECSNVNSAAIKHGRLFLVLLLFILF